MKAPKIIFTDIDGTIREASGHIPKSTVRAIHELQQAGYLVVVSTGRPECEIPDRVYEIGFDGYISACGAQVRFHDEIVLDQVIPEDLFRGIVSYMEDHEIVGYFQCPKKNFVLASQKELYLSYDERSHALLPEGSERLYPEPAFAATAEDVIHPQKMAFWGNKTSVEQFRAENDPRFEILPLAIPSQEKYTGEIMVEGHSKGNAILTLLSHLGISQEEAVAVGDGSNDITMFEICGYSIALGNGSEIAKKVADLVTENIDDDGFYHAFHEDLKLI